MVWRRQFIAVLILLALVSGAPAQTPQAIRYTVRFPAAQTNYLDVEAVVPTEGRPSIEMFMAVWTPGSHLIRKYERNQESVRATAGGRAMTVQKMAKNRWRITTAGAPEVTLTYRVFCHEM